MAESGGLSSSSSQNVGSQHTTSDEDSEGDDEDSSSKSSQNIETTLSNFRKLWQQELVTSPKHKATANKDNETNSSPLFLNNNLTDYEKAKTLFLKGVEQEQAGNMYEAIIYYKKAVQLVPDIELKLYETTKNKAKEHRKTAKEKEILPKVDTDIDEEQENELKGLDLLTRIERIMNQYQCLCFTQTPVTKTHFSALPTEIVLYILRWVVSGELDLRSLEKFGSCCRGFYLCSRDSEIWRLACARVWGIKCGTLESSSFKTWRQMFVERPRLQYSGCYISKTTYVRHGENSFQDQFYRPWHLVQYYRYLRFFPDGLVLMLTTPDEPSQCVSQLRFRTPKNPQILIGHYRLRSDKSVIVLVQRQENLKTSYSKNRRRRDIVESQKQTFQLNLQIQSYKKRAHCQLTFMEYTVFTVNRNGTETESKFELAGARYPPLWFSRVKSYTAESESLLQ